LLYEEGTRSNSERGLARAAPKSREGAGLVGFVRLLRIALLIVSGLSCNACLYGRIVYFNSPTLAAPSYFDNRTVKAPTPRPLPRCLHEATFPLTTAENARYHSFDELLETQHTRAFLVIRDDTIVYERYFHGVTETTELPAFSVSKTFAAVLVGRAVSEGLLSSVDESILTFIPELAKKGRYEDVTLESLLRMTSGIEFDEASIAGPTFYYSTDLRGLMYAYDVEWRPETHYLYGSINVQLLWDVLHRRLSGETVSHYFETELWGPLGAERPASWSLDSSSSGIEKFFGGFNATARDHARLGLLFLHGGTLNGRTILPEEWVDRSLSADPVAGLVHTTDGWVKRGRYQWFLTRDGRAYFAKGYNGQYVFVNPAKHAVFVRFGEGYGDVDWPSLFMRVADNL
jgi:CubicO group peptidase (beta-lactamase class C family)